MRSERNFSPLARYVLFIVLVLVLVTGYQAYRWYKNQGRRAPLVLAWLMYNGAIDFKPASTRNLGNLVQSPQPVSWAGLVRLDPAEIASIYPLHDEDRTLVALKDVPELLVTGLQAVEDRLERNPALPKWDILIRPAE